MLKQQLGSQCSECAAEGSAAESSSSLEAKCNLDQDSGLVNLKHTAKLTFYGFLK